MSQPTPGPSGHPNEIPQRPAGQTLLRFGGGALAVLGLVLFGMGVYDFMTVEGFGMPTKFWMCMVGVPLMGVGGMMVVGSFARSNLALLRAMSQARSCRSCGRTNDTHARFCDACGAQLA
jgi:hypothetical protein